MKLFLAQYSLTIFRDAVLSSVRPYCPVNASGQEVTGDHAAELVNAGKITRIDEARGGSAARREEGTGGWGEYWTTNYLITHYPPRTPGAGSSARQVRR